jgi:hypothetical protein
MVLLLMPLLLLLFMSFFCRRMANRDLQGPLYPNNMGQSVRMLPMLQQEDASTGHLATLPSWNLQNKCNGMKADSP